MPGDDNSTAHYYAAVINDLRNEIKRLSSALDELNQQSRAKQQAISDVERTITVLELRIESAHRAAETQRLSIATEPDTSVANLGVGDACVEVIARAGRGLRNSEILEALRNLGFPITSKNPINNVSTCLHNRAQRKGDVRRVGKCWELVSRSEVERQPQAEEVALSQ